MRTLLPIALITFLPVVASAVPPPPSGAHPRLFLTADVLAGIKANVAANGTAASSLVKRCQETIDHPEDYAERGGADGDNWPGAAVACAFAWQATGTQKYLDSAISYWNTALNDDQTRGDNAGCIVGATPDAASKTVTHDTGYPIRWYGPYLALTYDWLHDAPGVDPALLSHTRTCFQAWIDYYTKSGYLKDVAGANYNAGYVAAKTLIAVAEAGEDGATSDGYWAAAVSDIFDKLLIGDGLAGTGMPVGSPAGAMVGGDWAEGWQYGPLSVLEYAFSARALEQSGAPLPEIETWAGDLVLNYIYAQTPARDSFYTDGDFDNDAIYPAPNGRILSAVFGGATSADALGFARFMRDLQKIKGGDHPFEAIGEVLASKVMAKDFNAVDRPLWYLAHGTRRVYARSSWDAKASWSVFSAGPHVVPDHDHVDAGNFVFSRGADHLVVDPTGYGQRGTLTSNAPTIDADTVKGDYKPSQTGWSKAELLWARGVASGVAAARSDYAKAFNYADTTSDIPYARRDWVFLPEGEIVLIDRVRANNAAEVTYLNVHTTTALTLTGNVATASVGSSDLAIHNVVLSGGTPEVHAVPKDDNCYTGACTGGRLPTFDYAVKIPGPKALAVHVLDGLAKGEMPATIGSMNEAPYDVGGDNQAVLGAAVFRSSKQSYVLASSAQDGMAGTKLTYGVPGMSAARHIVFDAPENADGKSDVTASVSADRCVVNVVPGATYAGHPLMFQVSTATDGCKVTEDLDVPAGSTPPSGDAGFTGSSNGSGGASMAGSGSPGGSLGTPASPGGMDSGGCGCVTPGANARSTGAGWLGLLVLLPLRRKRTRAYTLKA